MSNQDQSFTNSQDKKSPENLTLKNSNEDEKSNSGNKQRDYNDIFKDCQVFTYQAPWLIHAINFSTNPNYPYTVGICSFLEETQNYVSILSLSTANSSFQPIINFPHKYPPTKLMWIPDTRGNYENVMATSGESLKIYNINYDKQQEEQKANLKNQSEFSAPLTSFDWNNESKNLIGTASIDTTCTIWDIEKGQVETQLIAHDKEVYDISFSPEKNLFASVGADGSCRQFDLRNLESSTVLYETENCQPLLRLGWNKNDANYVAVIAMEQNVITILDTRMPLHPICRLINHKDCVNAIAWAPQSSQHICSVSDDCQALIWDLTDNKYDIREPLLEYKSEEEIGNLAWSQLQNDWLAICWDKSLQILKV